MNTQTSYFVTQTDGQWHGVHHGRPEPLEDDGIYLKIISKYPNMACLNTGGGCMAIHHTINESGGYFLITDHEGEGLPDDDATQVLCGRYDENGSLDANEEGVIVPVAELEAWIDRALDPERTLSAVFSRMVREELADHLTEIRARNATQDYAKSCATHDFCDANMIMLAALSEYSGIEEDELDLEANTAIMNAAWDESKSKGFA